MGRKFGFLAVVVALALPAAAAPKPGSITGQVKNSGGIPQMGAMVEVLSTASSAITVFTDAKGVFTAADLAPGVYQLKVSAPSFLPTVRENVSLKAGASAIVNVTLNTL